MLDGNFINKFKSIGFDTRKGVAASMMVPLLLLRDRIGQINLNVVVNGQGDRFYRLSGT